jgi:hypothetical protein
MIDSFSTSSHESSRNKQRRDSFTLNLRQLHLILDFSFRYSEIGERLLSLAKSNVQRATCPIITVRKGKMASFRRCIVLGSPAAIILCLWNIISATTQWIIPKNNDIDIPQHASFWYASSAPPIVADSVARRVDSEQQQQQQQQLVISSARRNKTLVVLLGNLRGGEKAWNSLYQHVLDVNQADLALLTQGPTPAIYHNASLFQRSKYIWNVPHYADWADAFDLINGTAWRDELLPIYDTAPTNMLLGPVSGHPGSGAIIFMLRWFLSQRIQELNLHKKYDRFIVTRNDHYYVCRHDVAVLDKRFVWIPRGQNWGGIMDRHLVCSNKHVLAALDILPPLLQHPERYRNILSKADYNTERFVLKRWKEQVPHLKDAVRRFNGVMFTCNTQDDATSWKKSSPQVIPEGVFMKYKMEYTESHQTCLNKIVRPVTS